MADNSVLILGGAGQLGTVIVDTFNLAGWHCISVDFRENSSAGTSILLEPGSSMRSMAQAIKASLGATQVQAVVAVAGGWAGGSIDDEESFASIERMIAFNLYSSAVACHVACHHLVQPSGLLVLTGADAALGATPGMIGYGLSKVGVHHLVKSLATTESKLRADVCAILPLCLDTAQNRADMPTANFANWTPLSVVAEKILLWARDSSSRVKSGSLVRVITFDGETTLSTVEEH